MSMHKARLIFQELFPAVVEVRGKTIMFLPVQKQLIQVFVCQKKSPLHNRQPQSSWNTETEVTSLYEITPLL